MTRKIIILGLISGAMAVLSYSPSSAQGLAKGAERLMSVEELLESDYQAISVNFDTSRGSFLLQVYPEIAPLSAENFLRLVSAGFYDGIKVHRVVDGFVMQAGEVPDKSPKAELIKEFGDEVNRVHHEPGTVSFAKLYDTEKKQYLKNSASAQFFINLGDNSRLDENFTVFGVVKWGMETVKKIRIGDEIIRAYIVAPL